MARPTCSPPLPGGHVLLSQCTVTHSCASPHPWQYFEEDGTWITAWIPLQQSAPCLLFNVPWSERGATHTPAPAGMLCTAVWSDSHTSLPLHKVVSVAMYDSPPLPFMCIQYMCSKQQFSDVSSASDALAYCFQGSSCWLCPLWLHDEAIHQRWARNWIHVNCDVWWHGAKCISLSFFLLFKLASTCKTAASCLAEGIGGAVHVEGDAW